MGEERVECRDAGGFAFHHQFLVIGLLLGDFIVVEPVQRIAGTSLVGSQLDVATGGFHFRFQVRVDF